MTNWRAEFTGMGAAAVVGLAAFTGANAVVRVWELDTSGAVFCGSIVGILIAATDRAFTEAARS